MIKVKLSDLANIKMGQSPQGETCNENGDGIPLLNGPSEFTSFYPIAKQYTNDPKKICQEFDILFCVRGSTTGRMNWADKKYAIGRGLASISHKKGKEFNHFLKYLIEYNLDSILNLTSGSTFPNLTNDNLASYEFYVPEIEVQKKISMFLSNIDSKIELNNRINSELEAMAKTLYDYWFVQFDFPYSPPSEGCPQDGVGIGKPYKTSGGKMVWNKELKREIPEGWEDGTLDDLGEIIGGSTPSKAVDDNFCSESIPWITPKDLSLNSGKKFISKGELDVSEKGFRSASLKTLSKNSILLSSRAPIGYMVIARNDVTTNQGFKSFVPSKGYSTPFIFYTIKNNMKVIEANASGSTFKEISGGVLKSISVCLSNKNIIDLFSKKVESIFKQQDVLEQENQELASLRDWLLPMLMNGQVSVGDVVEELGMVAEESARYKK
jgi:type I restriction enzyme S subunit